MELSVIMRVLLLCISTLLVPNLPTALGGEGTSTSTSEPAVTTTLAPTPSSTHASHGANKSAYNISISSSATAHQTTSMADPPHSLSASPTAPNHSTSSMAVATPALTTVNALESSPSTHPHSTDTVPSSVSSTMTSSYAANNVTGSTSATTTNNVTETGSTSAATTTTSHGKTSASPPPVTTGNANTSDGSTAAPVSTTVTPGSITVTASAHSTPTQPSPNTSTTPTTGSTASTTSSGTLTPSHKDTTTSTSISTAAATVNKSSSVAPTSAAFSTTTKLTTSTVAPATTAGSPPGPKLLINEVNLIFNETGVNTFVEIKGPANFSANMTLIILNGIDGFVVYRVDVLVNLSSAGLHLHKIPRQDVAFNETMYAVVVFCNDEASNSSLHLHERFAVDLFDSFIFSTNTTARVNSSLQEIMITENQNLFVINQEALPQGQYSISRCEGDGPKDQGAFMVTPVTPDAPNNCSKQPGVTVQLKLPKADCMKWQGESKMVDGLLSYMVGTMNKACQCGVSRMLFSNRTITCGSVIFEAMLAAAGPQQSALVIRAFVDNVANSSHVTVGDQNFDVDVCSATRSCNILKPVAPPSTKDGGDNIKVTVSVVVSCVVLFIIVVITVVFYIKRKRRGILQFRMMRLDEDNDLIGDMDDFVGGGAGGEPSFSNPLYGRGK